MRHLVRDCLFRSLLVCSCLPLAATLRPRYMSTTKKHFLEEPGSSEPYKRARFENHPESPDAPPQSTTRPAKRDAAGWAKSRKGKEKHTKNAGRRRGPRPTEPSETPQNDNDDDGSRAPRLPKRMTALLLGFCGSGCSGMQMCVPSPDLFSCASLSHSKSTKRQDDRGRLVRCPRSCGRRLQGQCRRSYQGASPSTPAGCYTERG